MVSVTPMTEHSLVGEQDFRNQAKKSRYSRNKSPGMPTGLGLANLKSPKELRNEILTQKNSMLQGYKQDPSNPAVVPVFNMLETI